MEEWTRSEIILALQLLALAGSALLILNQLRQQTQKQRIDRLIAWKASLHSLNQLAMQYPETFKLLYPGKTKEEVRDLTAAYASLHALEVIYYMRKEEFPPPLLEKFLAAYVSGDDMQKAWEIPASHSAFTNEFQYKLNEVISEERAKKAQ